MMKIIVFEPNYLGDVLMTVPALRLLRAGFKDVRITAVINDGLSDALDGFVDDFIKKPAKMKLADRLVLLKKIREHKPDKTVLFKTTLGNAVIAFLSGASERAGVDTEFSLPFLTKAFTRGSSQPPFYSEYVEVVRLAGASGDVELKLKINLSEDTRLAAAKILKENGIDASLSARNKIIAVSPGSTRPAKMWNGKRYSALIDALDSSYRIIITGTPAERNLAEEIAAGCTNNKPVPLAGLTTIPQLAAILEICSLYIGPDSGALYLAVASGTPVVGLFGSTDPSLYGPFNNGDVVIYKKEPCAPCFREDCDRRDFCMDKISVGEVHESAEKILKKNGK